ncbi:MAG TPA: Na+/H+ antiporter [Tepidisphaeraceae bacterium]|nr:Na+/H+ antiporter [Tepidisphaeraceae bacterium]
MIDSSTFAVLASAGGGSGQLIEVVLGLLLLVAGIAMVAEKLRLPYPILLVVSGMVIGLVPGLPPVQLAPEYVFLLFLPPLLYYSGSHTTWRDFRQNLRPILMLAFGLVLFTTAVVAILMRALIPEMPWPAAIALGAIVSPPDAIAAAAIAQRLAAPKRIVIILEGESLINDASALVLYKLAIAAAMSGMLQGEIIHATWKLPLVGIGGVLIGLLAAWATLHVRRRVHLVSVEGTIALLTPFVAYLPAEWLGCSGVLAAVSAGVYMSRQTPRYLTGRSRLRDAAVWETLVFLMNGLIFVLIGLQLPDVVSALSEVSVATLIWWSVALSGVVIIVRLLWVFPMAWIPRIVSAKVRNSEPPPPASWLTVIGWAGMRGIVTLAAAMALPNDFP